MSITLHNDESGDLITCGIGIPIVVVPVLIYPNNTHALVVEGVKEAGQSKMRSLTEQEAQIAVSMGLVMKKHRTTLF